ncbi:MAG: HD domain-containing protein [Desulfosporosinus sp.]|nr:HD domain-containing protein [Desulfosporosinus sp.]
MFYRVHQFTHAFFPHINCLEIKWTRNTLSPEAYALFLKQSRTEQRHALDVAKSIFNNNRALSYSDLQNLLAAALLHDCGKSIVSIRLWQRVFIVLMQKMPQPLWSCLENSHTIFALPLKISTQHATWGGCLAEKAGLNPEICLLIREHHAPKTKLGRILARADNTH